MNRRSFLTGLAGILAASQAPLIVRAESIMRVKPIVLPGDEELTFGWYIWLHRSSHCGTTVTTAGTSVLTP